MSDQSQGPGWWQASDGKWYPPEQAPGYQAPAGAPTPGGGLDIGAALTYGWNKFVQYIGQVIVIVLIIFAVQIVFNIISRVIQGSINSVILGLAISFVFIAVGFIISAVLQLGLIRMGLMITNGQTPEPGTVFKFDNVGPFIVASILQGLLVFVGLFACCIGALVVALFTLFYGYYIVDRNAQPVDSLTSSFNLVKDNLGTVLVFAIVVVVINLLTCGLGAGVTQIATAYAYRQLNGQPVAP